ncbi:MAG: C40 family peptidase [Candidatus Moranbacteria bacterium]|nr:C40 family peptidase [Candidatus Moranbacteria bacterium]
MNLEMPPKSAELRPDRESEAERNHRPATRFIIEKGKKHDAENQDSGSLFKVHQIRVGRNNPDGSASYYKLSDLSNTDRIEISMRDRNGTRDIDLPEEMLGKIAAFIREDHRREGKFDCSSFVHLANGIPHEFGSMVISKWDVSDFDEGTLAPGDSVMISKDREHMNVTHLALYLGEGLYLSKFGNAGKLIVATMKNMKKAFEGKYAFHIRPKNPDIGKDIRRGEDIRKRTMEIEEEEGLLRLELDDLEKRYEEASGAGLSTSEQIGLLRRRDKPRERLLALNDEKSALMLEALEMGIVLFSEDSASGRGNTEDRGPATSPVSGGGE